MPFNLKMRMVDEIVKNKAVIVLKNGKKYTGIGDCLVSLPLNDDTEDETEFLRFIVEGEDDLYLTDSDISEYSICN